MRCLDGRVLASRAPKCSQQRGRVQLLGLTAPCLIPCRVRVDRESWLCPSRVSSGAVEAVFVIRRGIALGQGDQ
jgi:hypothetical protein